MAGDESSVLDLDALIVEPPLDSCPEEKLGAVLRSMLACIRWLLADARARREGRK